MTNPFKRTSTSIRLKWVSHPIWRSRVWRKGLYPFRCELPDFSLSYWSSMEDWSDVDFCWIGCFAWRRTSEYIYLAVYNQSEGADWQSTFVVVSKQCEEDQFTSMGITSVRSSTRSKRSHAVGCRNETWRSITVSSLESFRCESNYSLTSEFIDTDVGEVDVACRWTRMSEELVERSWLRRDDSGSVYWILSWRLKTSNTRSRVRRRKWSSSASSTRRADFVFFGLQTSLTNLLNRFLDTSRFCPVLSLLVGSFLLSSEIRSSTNHSSVSTDRYIALKVSLYSSPTHSES